MQCHVMLNKLGLAFPYRGLPPILWRFESIPGYHRPPLSHLSSQPSPALPGLIVAHHCSAIGGPLPANFVRL